MPPVSKKAILAELKRLYPDAGPELHFTTPYETLVATILSAQCTDKQVNKVTPAVFARFPDAQAMAEASIDELYPMVKSCGFKSKAGHIIEACKIIAQRHGGEVPSTMEELTALPGVGRKTANVVMANAFHIPAIAVDTHVFRVSNRLGLATAEDVLQTEKQLMRAIPKADWRDAHHWLIFHGRRVCKAQHPLCDECTLRDMCRAKRERRKSMKASGAPSKETDSHE